MKLSVVIPVYGVEQYIARCARSVLEQAYADKEIIFVDDASPDQSMAVLAEVLKDYPVPVTILHHPVNRGLAAARKTGIEAATGDYIVSVDSDDYIEPDALALLAAEASASGADIIRMGAWFEQADRRVLYLGPWTDDAQAYTCLILSGKTLPGVWMHMVRRDLYERTGCYPIEGLNYGEDFVVLPRLAWSANRIAHVEQPLYHYNQANTSSMVHTVSHAAISNLIQAFEVLTAYFAGNTGCMDALRAGQWLKKTEHIMMVDKADYALVDTIHCMPPMDTSSMNRPQRIAAYLMAKRHWYVLRLYCRLFDGLLKFKQKAHKPCSI